MRVSTVRADEEKSMGQMTDVQSLIDELGPVFAERAAAADEGDRFVAENFAQLKERALVAAGVPEELGGGGLSHGELGEMLRQLAHYCGSTALAFSMHTHQVATNAWRWRHQKAPVDDLLKRVAGENIVLLSSGGSDWLQGSGTATKVEGGYRINARKIFSSGAPAGDLLMTSAVYDDHQAGIAEAARDLAVEKLRKRSADNHAVDLVGEMENQVGMARLALDDMFAAAATNDPGLVATNRIMMGRTLVARGALNAVGLAMEAAGGAAFYRSAGLERLFRDIQAARYHPLREGAQRAFAGKLALGRDVDAD